MGPFEDILTSNIISTYHAYEAAKRSGVKRFVLASTNHVQHGSSKAVDGGPGSIDASRLGGRQMTLSDPPTPDSYYAASKLLNEDMGKLFQNMEQFRSCVPSHWVGPLRRPHRVEGH